MAIYDTTPQSVKDIVANSKYSSTVPGYSDTFNKIVDQLAGSRSNSETTQKWTAQRIDNALSQFSNLFSSNVGRAPTPDELNKALTESVGQYLLSKPGGGNGAEADPVDFRNQVAQYIGDTFQPQANETAQTKLSDLSTQAGTLADQYTEMGKKSLGNLSDELKNYQVSLFDKLRPQLNLAAQAGGYQDSGGQTLQEQGALKDLGDQATGILAPLQYELSNNANSIRFGGSSAPYSLASSTAAGQPATLASLGSGALNMNYNQYLQKLNNDAAMARLEFSKGGGYTPFTQAMQSSLGTLASAGLAGGVNNAGGALTSGWTGSSGGGGGLPLDKYALAGAAA